MRRVVALAAFCFALSLLPACACTEWAPATRPADQQSRPVDAPWTAGARQASVESRFCRPVVFLAEGRKDFRFITPDGATHDPASIAETSIRFIKSNHRWKALTPDYSQLASGGLSCCTFILICIDPVVVISTPIPTEYRERFVSAEMLLNDPAPGATAGLILPYGFYARTTFTTPTDFLWFSPDLNIAPQAAEFLAASTRRIPVPWGALILTRDANLWRVTAEPNAPPTN